MYASGTIPVSIAILNSFKYNYIKKYWKFDVFIYNSTRAYDFFSMGCRVDNSVVPLCHNAEHGYTILMTYWYLNTNNQILKFLFKCLINLFKTHIDIYVGIFQPWHARQSLSTCRVILFKFDFFLPTYNFLLFVC